MLDIWLQNSLRLVSVFSPDFLEEGNNGVMSPATHLCVQNNEEPQKIPGDVPKSQEKNLDPHPTRPLEPYTLDPSQSQVSNCIIYSYLSLA